MAERTKPPTDLTRLQRAGGWLWRWSKRTVVVVATPLVAYFAVVVVGLIPVNNDFTESPDGVEVMLVSSAIHADLVLPLQFQEINWRTIFPPEYFQGDTSGATHAMIGWGDAGFYLNTPTWNDLRLSTAANALLWPSETCLHVGLTREESVRPLAHSVRISPAQYIAMVKFIRGSILTDETGQAKNIPISYGRSDAFFEATGRYHALNTCNSWIGRAMRAAGIRVPWLTPLPKSAYLYLPDERSTP